MSRGTFDYNRDLSDTQEYVSRDLHELAARGNITFQVLRSGNVIHNLYPILFNNPTIIDYVGTGSYTLISSRGVYGYDHSLKCITGAVNLDNVSVNFFIPPTLAARIGFLTYLGVYQCVGYAYSHINLIQSGYLYAISIRFNLSSGDIAIKVAGGTYQTIGNTTITSVTPSPLIYKLVIDTTTKYYDSLKVNVDKVIDLTAYALDSSVIALADQIAYEFVLQTTSAASISGYLQEVITTINEV